MCTCINVNLDDDNEGEGGTERINDADTIVEVAKMRNKNTRMMTRKENIASALDA